MIQPSKKLGFHQIGIVISARLELLYMKITLFINVGILLINRVGFFKSLSDQTWLDILLLIVK